MGNLTYNSCNVFKNNIDYKKMQEEKWIKTFCEPLSNMIKQYVIPKFNWNGTMDILMGCYTSPEYGSYKIVFKNEEKEICYITADIIFGNWKLYKSE
jgi:hypothetical protein